MMEPSEDRAVVGPVRPYDVVLEGGGVKGIALAGALEVLEESGYRPERIAGSSAGAVVAALLASGYGAGELRDLVRETPFASFLDGGVTARVPLVGPAARVLFRHGVHPGDALERWLRGLLEARGVRRFGDLPYAVDSGSAASDGAESRGARGADGSSGASSAFGCRLQIIVSDVTNRRLLVLPRDAAAVGVSPAEMDVARAVRASCTIPLLFEPVRLPLPGGGKLRLVDGGLLSNFPVWLFDVRDRSPRWPTFGLKLVKESRDALLEPVRQPPSLAAYVTSLVRTMLEAHDRRHFDEAEFVRTITIDTLDVQTTDFRLPPERQEALVESGRRAARLFLDGWDFEGYVRAYRDVVPPTRRELNERVLREAASREGGGAL